MRRMIAFVYLISSKRYKQDREKKTVSFDELVHVLEDNGIEYSSEDIEELRQELDPQRTGNVTREVFANSCIDHVIC